MARGSVRRVGLLADTHSNKSDGSDLPDAVLKAFKGVDLIVHLGDVGRKGILDRLATVAPVWVPVGGNKGYVPAGGADGAVFVVDGTSTMGLSFNLAQPDKKIAVDDSAISFDGDMAALLKRRFKAEVDVVAFGGTHRPFNDSYGGVLFVNPGSPTLPMEGTPASVAIVDLATTPKARIVAL